MATVYQDMIKRDDEAAKPLYYVKDRAILQRPAQTSAGRRMGFAVCEVCDGVDPAEVCAILNKGEPATSVRV